MIAASFSGTIKVSSNNIKVMGDGSFSAKLTKV